MDNMYKLSIIVPVFCVEKYIERCVRSLFSQTLDGIEFIFIDDCSPDSSMDILEKLIEEYRPRFAGNKWVVRTERMVTNCGQAAIRHHGIQLANGHYIIHCDSDDYVEPSMYQMMYEKAVDEKSDIVICNYVNDFGNHKVKKKTKLSSKVNAVDIVSGMLSHRYSCSVWNKMIRKELYANPIKFPVYNYGEDMALMCQVCFYAQKISLVEDVLYHYCFNPESISRDKSSVEMIIKSFNHTCNNAKLLECFFVENKADSKIFNSLVSLKSNERDRLLPLINNNDYYKIWKSTFSEINGQILLNRYIPIKYKIRFLLGMTRLYVPIGRLIK